MFWLLTLPTVYAGERYALVVGANVGHATEAPLRYAVEDARRMEGALRDLGGFPAENVVRLEAPTATRMREVLAHLNARLRGDGAEGAVLLVYYSGHADELSLHLGPTDIGWDELRDMVAGSAATARVLVVDACRSGEATQVKGARPVEPFELHAPSLPVPEGMAIITSATAGEIAQESSSLRGSFFSHHFVSGMRGAADLDGDGRVTLTEAFDYGSARTVESTAATLDGIQHPTYAYDIKGRVDLVLTEPSRLAGQSFVALSEPGQYLFWGAAKTLIAEVSLTTGSRLIALPPGNYRVQRRLPARMYEGEIEVDASTTVDLAAVRLRVIEYDQLARKGAGAGTAIGVSLWGGVMGSVVGYGSFGHGAVQVSYDSPKITLDAGIERGLSVEYNDSLMGYMDHVGGHLGVRRVADIGHFGLSAGLRVGAIWQRQRYVNQDWPYVAPTNRQVMPYVGPLFQHEYHLPAGWFVAMETHARVVATVTERRMDSDVAGTWGEVYPSRGLAPKWIGSASFGVGKRW